VHERGIVSEQGLYFLGLDFLYAFTSENVGGVGRDAARIARHIASLPVVPDVSIPPAGDG
jgi:putative flavoprotein involved in K+ transport